MLRSPFVRWEDRFGDGAPGVDPREGGLGVCRGCGTTFAWFGYGELCGWCHEEKHPSFVVVRQKDGVLNAEKAPEGAFTDSPTSTSPAITRGEKVSRV